MPKPKKEARTGRAAASPAGAASHAQAPRVPHATGWRKVSSKDRAFIAHFAESGFKDAEASATAAGFRQANIGQKLSRRLSDLIESEKIRLAVIQQMELDEALRLLASMARSCDDSKVQLQALRTVLQVHGALTDKPLPAADRSSLRRQIESIAARLRQAGRAGKGSKTRIRASVERQTLDLETVEIEPKTDFEGADTAQDARDMDLDLQAVGRSDD